MITRPTLLAPSLLSADFAALGDAVRACEAAGCDVMHVDVMDGHFVPNITIGPLVVQAIKPHTSLPLDCHLMISEPDRYIDAFATAGASWISVHAETCDHLHRTLSRIREVGCRPGVVINPVTPLEYAMEAAGAADFVLMMSVNPGFGGQQFIPSFLPRCERLRTWLDSNGFSHVEIEVDGGIKADNIRSVVDAGASIIVSGSGLFSGDLAANVRAMRAALA